MMVKTKDLIEINSRETVPLRGEGQYHRNGNELTCELCTLIFQGLDDSLLNNEEEVIHQFVLLCTYSSNHAIVSCPSPIL